jgi:hypothetical protein
MTTHSLDRLYEHLTPRERLPLIMAAHVRGDVAERKRLVASARTRTYEVPDYFPLARALGQAAHWHMLTLLDLAGHFWQWWGLWLSSARLQDPAEGVARRPGQRAATGRKKRRIADADRIEPYRARGITRYYASRFVAHVDGWKQFCVDFHADPQVQLKYLIGWGFVALTEEAARHLAFGAEEADRFMRLETVPVANDATLERGPVPIETAGDLVRDWHVFLEQLVDREGGA